jgi:hypothetical protein
MGRVAGACAILAALTTAAAFIGNLGADEPIAPRNTAVIQTTGGACDTVAVTP